MKRFLRKKWHSIPIGIVAILMALILVAGSAFAAYNFLNLTTDIYVDEPLTIEYNLQGNYGGDSNWHLLGDADSMTLERSAGDSFGMSLRVTNTADNPLTVNTLFSGQTTWFTFGGFPSASSCPNGVTDFWVTIDVAGDAPPATYSVTFSFERS